MDALLVKSLTKLRKACGRSHRDVRDVVDAAQTRLAAGQLPPAPFTPFLVACATRSSGKLVAVALECMEKLLAYGLSPDARHVPDVVRRAWNSSQRGDGDGEGDDTTNALLEREMDYIVATACDLTAHPDETVQLQVLRVFLTAVTTPACHVHEQMLLRAVRACFHVQLRSKSTMTRTVALATLQQMTSLVVQRMEAVPTMDAQQDPNMPLYASVATLLDLRLESTENKATSPFPSIHHKDAFLLFRALCRLASRAPDADAALERNVLALRLVHLVLRDSGPSFRRGHRFVQLIRHALCHALLEHCTSSDTSLVSHSLHVFVLLVQHFKHHLKTELEIFISSLLLRLLTSDHASCEHKSLVLEALAAICHDPATLGDIFLNYDCDWNTADLFQQIVHALAKIAKGGSGGGGRSDTMHARPAGLQDDDDTLAGQGLACLTAIAASLQRAANFVASEDAAVAVPRGPVASTASAVATFASKQKQQQELATGILHFNVKPRQGLAYLVARGHVGHGTASDVARFLHDQHARLDKTVVGEYLGQGVDVAGGFCVDVLQAYVACLDFRGMELDAAIRHFLAGFRLPGEAQKIDRMMEHFAQRYVACCPDTTLSVDTAYVLSFSIIMLQTDLHNPSIPDDKKMTKAAFLKNNRGIHDGRDLPDDYLSAIYDRIRATPIALKDDRAPARRTAASVPSLFGTSSADALRVRRDAFLKERATLVEHSEALFQRRARPRAFQHVSRPHERLHVRPMFATLWAPLLAACAVTFERLERPDAIHACLTAFRHAVHLAARLQMKAERDALVVVWTKFTALEAASSVRLEWKHVEALKTLCETSVDEGNYLDDAWHAVLTTLSHLARLTLRGRDGLDVDDASGAPDGGVASLDDANAAYIAQTMDPVTSDRVFTSSVALHDAAWHAFVVQLTIVSLSECSGVESVVGTAASALSSSPRVSPRVFSLQKLVEVVDMNLTTRTRAAWTTTWPTLARHFTTMGCHEDVRVRLYAIDSLRQLSMKLLATGDDDKDHTEPLRVLAPFEVIFANAPARETRELVLGCMEHVVLARMDTMRAGWHTIWSVWRLAAETSDARSVAQAFEMAQKVLATLPDALVDVVDDVIECLVAFGVCGADDVAPETLALTHVGVESVGLLRQVWMDMVGQHNDGVEADQARHMPWMWRVVTALTTLAVDRRLEVQVAALDALFDGLTAHGRTFSSRAWHHLFTTVLLPLVDDVQALERTQGRGRGVQLPRGTGTPATVCRARVVACFGHVYERVGYLPDVLRLVGKCLDAVDDATSTAAAVEEMLVTHGHKFSRSVWGLIADEMRHVLTRVTPTWMLAGVAARHRDDAARDFVSPRARSCLSLYPDVVATLGYTFASPTRMLDERQAHARVPSSTHLALWLAMQKMVGTVLASRGRVALTDGHAHALVASLCASFELARHVNDALAWRRELHGRGWRYGLGKPRAEENVSSLLPQEVMGKAQYLHVLCAAVDGGGPARADGARKDLARLIRSTVTEYLAWNGIHGVLLGVDNEENGGPEDAPQRVASFTSLIVAMLMELVKWTSDEFQRHRTWLYPLLTHLVLVPDAAVRVALQTVFENVIGPLLPSPMPSNVE